MPAGDPEPERNSRDRRSHGEEYPGHGDAGSLEERYAAPEQPCPRDDGDADGEEEDEPE